MKTGQPIEDYEVNTATRNAFKHMARDVLISQKIRYSDSAIRYALQYVMHKALREAHINIEHAEINDYVELVAKEPETERDDVLIKTLAAPRHQVPRC